MKYFITCIFACLLFCWGCVSHLDQRGFDLKTKIHSVTNTTYDENGYNINGIDTDGFNFDGYDQNGFNKNGFDKDGYNNKRYDQDGFDKNGYNKDGFDRDGYNIEGYDKNNFNRNGYHKITKTKYNTNGYNKNNELNTEKIKRSLTSNFSVPLKVSEEIYKLTLYPLKGEFETSIEYQKRLSKIKTIEAQKKEEANERLFFLNFPLGDVFKGDSYSSDKGIICKYNADTQDYQIQIRKILSILHEITPGKSYTTTDQYGQKYIIETKHEIEQLISFSEEAYKYYPWSGSYSDYFFKEFSCHVSRDVARKKNLKGQIIYKINDTLPPHNEVKRLGPTSDILLHIVMTEQGFYAKAEAFILYDDKWNLIHYEI